MTGSGWWQRVGRVFRWKPGTYRQAWLSALFGPGVTWFVIWSVLGTHSFWPALGLMAGVEATLVFGLAQSHQLRRRRHRQAEVEALYEAAIWRPYTKSQPPVP